MGTKKLFVEYCYSSLHNKIKVVEMTVDGKFHRFNWMNEVGQKELMSELVSDYTYNLQNYGSEIDLDRDVPELDHLVSIGAV
jgi:hypothetical protein